MTPRTNNGNKAPRVYSVWDGLVSSHCVAPPSTPLSLPPFLLRTLTFLPPPLHPSFRPSIHPTPS